MIGINIEKLKKSLTWDETINLMGNDIYVTYFKNGFRTEKYYLVGYALEMGKNTVQDLIVEDDEKALKHVDFKTVLVFKTPESVFIEKDAFIQIETLDDLKGYVKNKWYETYNEFQSLSDREKSWMNEREFEKMLTCSGKLLLINDICNDLGIQVMEIGVK